MIIEIGTITLNNLVADGDGTFWYVEPDGLEGWDSPPVVSTVLDIPTVPGGVSAEIKYGPRIITVKGLAKATSSTNCYEAQYTLSSVTNVTDRFTPLTFAVTEDIRRRCLVTRSDGPRMRLVGNNAFRFQVTFRADDPYKYDNSDNPYI